MKKSLAALSLSLLLLCCAAAASAGVFGHFVSEEDNTYIIILSEPINTNLQGVYIGNSNYKLSLDRDEKEDGSSIRVFTPLDESDAIIELRLEYEDDSKQAALVTGYIKRFDADGKLMEDQSVPDMQGVRFIRQYVPDVSELRGTMWNRTSMTISGTGRTYPFDGSVLEFFDTGENAGQIPDNAERIYPFTYTVLDDSLLLNIEAGGKTTEATVRIQSNVLIVTIENSTLFFLPATL